MSRPYDHLMDHDHWRETSLDAVVAARDEYPGLRLRRCACGMWFLPQGKSLNAVTCTPCYWAERKAREKAEARREWNQAIRNGYIPIRDRPKPLPDTAAHKTSGPVAAVSDKTAPHAESESCQLDLFEAAA